ncbi:hypothetical protein ACIRA2_17970 [Streptomyces griseoviridis]
MSPRLSVRSGFAPDAPGDAVVVLVVDPGGAPGERAVALLSGYCYEGDGAVHLVRTDGWAEREVDGESLRLAIAVYPVALAHVGVEAGQFAERSAVDPEAVIVLRARTALPSAPVGRLSDATAVFSAAPEISVDELLASDDWPMVLAPPPGD